MDKQTFIRTLTTERDMIRMQLSLQKSYPERHNEATVKRFRARLVKIDKLLKKAAQ